MTLALKLFRGEPAISAFDWHFTPTHSSSQDFSTSMWFEPPCAVTHTSFCPCVDHRSFGSTAAYYFALFRLAFAAAPALQRLNLAARHNSLARSTKSTRSLSLPLLVGAGFQVLFHSPPGVLFTFPSRYSALSVAKEYFAFPDGPG